MAHKIVVQQRKPEEMVFLKQNEAFIFNSHFGLDQESYINHREAQSYQGLDRRGKTITAAAWRNQLHFLSANLSQIQEWSKDKTESKNSQPSKTGTKTPKKGPKSNIGLAAILSEQIMEQEMSIAIRKLITSSLLMAS